MWSSTASGISDFGLYDVRERLLPDLEDRVLLVPLVELHRAVVRVDRGLDRVAHVVDVVGRQGGVRRARVDRVGGHLLQRLLLRQRVLVAGGVAVEDPDDLAVDHGRQGVGVDGQPRRDLLHPLTRRAVVEDLAVLVDPGGQHDVGVAELHCVEQLAEDVADPDAVLAVVGVGLRLAGRAAALRDVELDVVAAGGLADDRVERALLTEVDLRPVAVLARRRRESAARGQVLLGPHRLAVVAHRLVRRSLRWLPKAAIRP